MFVTFLELSMLNGFRIILLIGVFLAIAGSVQSGDWRYSIWILVFLFSVLFMTFRSRVSQFVCQESNELKSPFEFLISSSCYLNSKKENEGQNFPR